MLRFASAFVALIVVVWPASATQRVDARPQALGFSISGSLGTARSFHTATLLPTGQILIAGGTDGSVALATAELYDPATGRITYVGSLANARYGHTATVLRNGTILIAGGRDGSSYVSSAEIYDPLSATFTPTGSPVVPRYRHSATRLASGRVLFAGGFNGAHVTASELYDPSTGTFSATGSLTAAREQHTATLLPNGTVLVAGGSQPATYLNSAELYNENTNAFAPTGTMLTRRAIHTATLLSNGKVLVAGGVNDGGTAAAAELYDPATGGFAATGALANNRANHSATLLPSGKVLIAGGLLASCELYNPATGTFELTSPITVLRSGHTATLLISGKVIIAGGRSISTQIATIETYDGRAPAFAASGFLPTARDSHTATLLPSGKVLITGGFDSGGNPTSSSALYDGSSGTFTTVGALQDARYGHTATLLPSGKVLVAGGFGGVGIGYLATAELFDPAFNTFTRTGALPAPRAFHTATLLPTGKVLVAGGMDGSIDVIAATLFDQETATFTAGASLTSGRSFHTATLLRSGKVLLYGGRTRAGNRTIGSPELFDHVTGTFVASGAVLASRESHTSTILPSGKVLIAGGRHAGSVMTALSTAELYDPDLDDAVRTASLGQARYGQSATLLLSGSILIAAGSGTTPTGGATAVTTSEIFDPENGTFASSATSGARYYHTATLLPSGKVLLAGGSATFPLDSSELYDEGSAFLDAWRPAISTTTIVANQLTAAGSRFTGIHAAGSEASAGNTQSSPTDHPIVLLRRIDNDEMILMPPVAFGPTSFTSGLRWAMNPGPAMVTVIANGTPSHALAASVQCGVSIVSQPADQLVALGASAAFHVDAIATFDYQWQKDTTGEGMWTDIFGATSATYVTPPVMGNDSGTSYRVVAKGNCRWLTSAPATLTVADENDPTANVVSPSGGEYWLLSTPDQPASRVVTWSMSDDIRVCKVRVALIYSNDGGQTYTEAAPDGQLPFVSGIDGGCRAPGEQATSLTYQIPAIFASGRAGSLYKIHVTVTDQAGNSTPVASANPFYIVQSNPDSVKTVILSNVSRMVSRQAITESEAAAVTGKLQELANHPRVQGLVIDLGTVTSVQTLYAQWDADPANPDKANAVLFGAGGIHQHLRASVYPAYTGVEYLVLVGDDRIIPMTRMQDRTVLLPETTYTDLAPTSTVGMALAAGRYLTDDPLAVADAMTTANFDEPPDLAIGRLVETPQEIITTIATYIGQDGILDLSALDPSSGHKVLVTGYDFLSNVSHQIRARWKAALGVSTPDSSTAPVDGTLIGGTWGLGNVNERADALRARMSGNGGTRYGLMAISGHASHYEEGVPGTDPFDIQGLSASAIYGADCGAPSGAGVDLAGAVIYAVGCHGGLSVPGSCSTDGSNSLDLPQTMLARGAVAYIANSGYGWGLKHGIGYGARLTQIFTEEMTTGGTIVVGKAVSETKQRYHLETPRYDPYDEKSVLQWTLFGLPMYAIRTGIVAGSSQLESKSAPTSNSEMLGAVRLERRLSEPRKGLRAETNALPNSLTQLTLSFDFTGGDVYTKYDSSGLALPPGPGCLDPNGCYYTLNGLVDRGTGVGDLPIQPYLIYDSRLSGTSQHGVLWKGGTYDEEAGWKPVIAELVSNGGDGSNHGSTPRTIILRPTAARVVPGADLVDCRPTDRERNSVTVTAGESIRDANGTFSIARRYRDVELEVFYFNDRTIPANNCERSGPSLGSGPFGGDYHQIAGSTVTWSVPATDASGVWRVVVVYNTNLVDGQSRGTWIPVELSNDGSGTFTGSVSPAGAARVTYVIQAVDNRGNVTWLDYVSAQMPASGVALGIPQTVDINLARPTNLAATATSTTTVALTWTASNGAASYDIYRSASGTNYVKIGSSSSAAYTDLLAAPSTAYLYAVKGVDGAAVASALSLPDVATTVMFTDPAITPGVTTIKAAHVTELRTAVNAVRVLAGSGSYAYVDPTLTAGVTTAKSAHITDLRSALAAARTTLSLPAIVYSGSAPDAGQPIKAVHITELRGATQ